MRKSNFLRGTNNGNIKSFIHVISSCDSNLVAYNYTYVHYRAYISFDKLLKMEAGKTIAENHPKNIQLQKAVREMEFVFSMAHRLVNDRLRENRFDFNNSSQTPQHETNQNKTCRSKFNESVASSQDLIACHTRSSNRTRSQNRSNNCALDLGDTTFQPIPINSKIAEVGRSESTIEQPKRTEANSETLDGNGTDKPSRMKTRSQSVKKELNAKRCRK